MQKTTRPWLFWLKRIGALAVVLTSYVAAYSLSLFDLDESEKAARILVQRELPPRLADDVTRIECSFPIVNKNDKPLKILKVNRSCSCTKADVDKKELLPNEQTFLRIAADVRGRTGPQRFTCQLVTDRERDSWFFEIGTTIFNRISFEPAVLNLGNLDPHSTSSGTFILTTYTTAGKIPAELESVQTPSDQIKASVIASEVDEKMEGLVRRQTKIKVDFAGQAISGEGSSDIEFNIKSNKEKSVKSSFHVKWNIRSIFVVDPPRVFVTNIDRKNDDSIIRKVQIRRIDKKEFHLGKASCACPGIRITGTEGREELQELTIRIETKDIKTYFFSEIIIETGNPNDVKIRIPVAVFRVAAQ